MESKLLTIGMSTYDDFDGVYFSIQALKMYHEIVNSSDVEIIVIDNNPFGRHSQKVKNFVKNWAKQIYIPYTNKKSTSVREQIFKNAKGKYTICMDCHVLFVKDSINHLLNYYKENKDCKNIVSGPMVYDDLKNIANKVFIFKKKRVAVIGNVEAKNIKF